MSVNVEQLVEAYLNVRGERERLLREYEVADSELKGDLSQIEAMMLEVCNDVNANSIKTQYGNDWDNFRKFVLEYNAVELLERRIHQGNFKQFLADHEGDGLPPGVNVMREYGISVRKAS
jgi:hypothetical protein